jgi:hypothetical protein
MTQVGYINWLYLHLHHTTCLSPHHTMCLSPHYTICLSRHHAMSLSPHHTSSYRMAGRFIFITILTILTVLTIHCTHYTHCTHCTHCAHCTHYTLTILTTHHAHTLYIIHHTHTLYTMYTTLLVPPEWVDRFLHPCDQAFTVPTIYELLHSAGLRVRALCTVLDMHCTHCFYAHYTHHLNTGQSLDARCPVHAVDLPRRTV